jgi:hypothetical protein
MAAVEEEALMRDTSRRNCRGEKVNTSSKSNAKVEEETVVVVAVAVAVGEETMGVAAVRVAVVVGGFRMVTTFSKFEPSPERLSNTVLKRRPWRQTPIKAARLVVTTTTTIVLPLLPKS